jgi:hypothetical protein
MAEQIAKIEHDMPNANSHVRALILSGEASSSSMQEMQQVLAVALPEFTDRFRFSINPKFVGVTGAAHRARQTVTDPFFTEPRKPHDHEFFGQEPLAHDEL